MELIWTSWEDLVLVDVIRTDDGDITLIKFS